jgi:hypothetical protein
MRMTQADVDAYLARQSKPNGRADLPPRELREREIQEAIASYLKSFGHACKFTVARMDKPTTTTPGQPDFIGVLRGVSFAMEVKRPGCKETREQSDELLMWQLAGSKVAVVHSVAEAVEFVVTQVLKQ